MNELYGTRKANQTGILLTKGKSRREDKGDKRKQKEEGHGKKTDTRRASRNRPHKDKAQGKFKDAAWRQNTGGSRI